MNHFSFTINYDYLHTTPFARRTAETSFNKQLFQNEIMFRFQIGKDKNDKELPNLPLSCHFSSAAQASKNGIREGIMCLFALASALIGGNLSQNIHVARMFT